MTKVDLTSLVDPDIDAFGLATHGACWGSGTGDPVVLDGVLVLGDGIF